MSITAVALQMCKRKSYDVVLTDINMPNLNGYGLLWAIKADAALRHLPVLLVVPEARREDIEMAAQDGAAGYLVKPFSKAALHGKLEKVLRAQAATV
jgi:two-component system, chemotaxis family, chemotaxis protein CheY